MAEVPHVKLHLLGKEGVRKAGRLCLDPQPPKPWAHLVTVLYRSLVASCPKGLGLSS